MGFDEVGKAFQIAGGIAFWNGESLGAEGGGFPDM